MLFTNRVCLLFKYTNIKYNHYKFADKNKNDLTSFMLHCKEDPVARK